MASADERSRVLREQLENLPTAMDQHGVRLQLSPGAWGGMVVEYLHCSERIDFGPMLEGLPDDMCPCPHWGYMLKGAMHIRYGDGAEEVIREGDVCYLPEGHTLWCEAGSTVIFFSPEAEQKTVGEHVFRKMQG